MWPSQYFQPGHPPLMKSANNVALTQDKCNPINFVIRPIKVRHIPFRTVNAKITHSNYGVCCRGVVGPSLLTITRPSMKQIHVGSVFSKSNWIKPGPNVLEWNWRRRSKGIWDWHCLFLHLLNGYREERNPEVLFEHSFPQSMINISWHWKKIGKKIPLHL